MLYVFYIVVWADISFQPALVTLVLRVGGLPVSLYFLGGLRLSVRWVILFHQSWVGFVLVRLAVVGFVRLLVLILTGRDYTRGGSVYVCFNHVYSVWRVVIMFSLPQFYPWENCTWWW